MQQNKKNNTQPFTMASGQKKSLVKPVRYTTTQQNQTQILPHANPDPISSKGLQCHPS